MPHIHLLLPRFPLLLFQSVSSLHCRPHCWWSGNCQGLCIEMSLVEREHTVFQFVRLTHKLPLRTWRAPVPGRWNISQSSIHTKVDSNLHLVVT